MADGVFNIHIGKMPYKTQNHSTAEWSKRSVISYTLAVDATHFIPNIQSTPYHVKKSEIDETSRELWELVEECYSSMVGRNERMKKIKVVPVLPNLVTSSDEVTLFATSQKNQQSQNCTSNCKTH